MRYPAHRAVRTFHIALKELSQRDTGVKSLIAGNAPKTAPQLSRWCARQKIRIAYEELPGKRLGASIDVQGKPFIVLSPDLRHSDNPQYSFVLAHEIAHIVRGHLDSPGFAAAGFSETTHPNGRLEQMIYAQDQEVEADVLALAILIPDDFLHDEVERGIWIPTTSIARNHNITLDLVAARCHLYRETHGYTRSAELRAEREKDNVAIGGRSMTDLISDMEPGLATGLQNFLPKIDERLGRYL